ncbi:MAG: hypothetical protein R3B13_23485 [Polyangiaceae bacterium]
MTHPFHRTPSVLVGAAIVFASLLACKKGSKESTGSASSGVAATGASDIQRSSHPGTEDGAKALLEELAKPGADTVAISKSLQPSAEDYAAVFDAETTTKLRALYDGAWSSGQIVIQGKPGQTEIKLHAATSEQLKSGAEEAKHCPGGYEKVAGAMKPGITIYCFKFVEPGQDLGMAFDGLTHVNGHWVIIPKPWRALR